MLFRSVRDSPEEHRYTVTPTQLDSSFSLAIAYAPTSLGRIPTVADIEAESERVWEEYWSKNGFVDLVRGSSDARADELQRRIILSQYLMRVNEAGDTPPQEVRPRDASSFHTCSSVDPHPEVGASKQRLGQSIVPSQPHAHILTSHLHSTANST